MAFSHGRYAQFSLTDSTTVARLYRNYLTNISMPRSVDTADTTVFSSSDKTSVIGARGGTIALAGKWDSTVDGYLGGIVGKNKAWIYYPNTTAATSIKYNGYGIITAYDVVAPVAGDVTWTANIIINGTVGRGTV